MRIFYKCLTAVLVAIVSSFSASAFYVDVDHPEAFKLVMDANYHEYTLKEGLNEFDLNVVGQYVAFQLDTSNWELVSFTDPNGGDVPYVSWQKAYQLQCSSKPTGTYKVVTRSKSASEPSYITLSSNNVESLNVSVQYTGQGTTPVEPQDGVFKVESTNSAGIIYVEPADETWEITSAIGLSTNADGSQYSVRFDQGSSLSFTVDTEKIVSDPTFITLNVDNPEGLNVQLSRNQVSETVTLVAGNNEISSTEGGTLTISANESWQIESVTGDGDVQNSGGEYVINFNAGDEYHYVVVTKQITAEPKLIITVDHPEALEVQFSSDYGGSFGEVITLTETVTEIGISGYQKVRIKPVSPWVVDTFSEDVLIKDGDYYTAWLFSGGDVNVSFTTSKPSFITLNVDTPEALTVQVMYADPDETFMTPTLVQGENKISSTYPGTLIVEAKDSWTIVSADGLMESENPMTGKKNYGTNFDAGSTNVYTVTTAKEEVQTSYITLTVDYPERVKVEVMDISISPVQPVDGVYKINTTNSGTIYVTPVSSNYGLSVPEDWKKNSDTGGFYFDFAAGATGEYFIGAYEQRYCTLTIDHPEAVKADVYYNEVLDHTLTLTEGENRFAITGWGSVKITPVSPWTIDTCVGDPNTANEDVTTGGYLIFIGTNADQTISITTSKSEPSYISLNVDRPEALFAFLEYDDGESGETTLVQGENKIYTEQSGVLTVFAKSPYVIESANGFDSMEGNYFLAFNAGDTGSYSITTKEETQSSYITLTVDYPERVKVEVMDITISPVEPVDGEFKINTTNGGTIYVTPVSSDYGITAPEGWISNDDNGGYYFDFTAGATDTYAITTFEQSLFTVNIDHPEAFRMVMDDYGHFYEVVAGDNKFNAKNGANNLCFYVNDTWEVVSFTGPNGAEITKNPYTNAYIIVYDSSTTGTYTVVTRESEVAFEGITINVDNLEAVTVSVEYFGEDPLTVEPEDGVYKIDTTPGGQGGTIFLDRVYPWDIVSAGGFTAHWRIPGRYYFDFYAGETGNYNVITKNTLEGATSITLNVDNPQALNVKVTYYSGVEKTIELQAGANKIPTADGGTLEVSAIEPWVISSAEGLTFLRDKYYLYFDAGEEGDYTISTSETGVETILDGEVIEVPVFNLQGLKVADSTDNLPAGIYIIAGKKVVVK